MSARRTHYRIALTPAGGGARFQPTGFPDLGAALFQRPVGTDSWVDCLHVESPQSLANHMEAFTWDEAAQAQVPELEGVPYVQVVDANGVFLTCSRLEPHRLASAYIMEGTVGDTGQTGVQWLPGRLGLAAGKPLDRARFAQAVFELDPLSLIHGVFFAQSSKSNWPRQPRLARAVTAFIDAEDVRAAISGGVKTDYVDTAGGNAEAGYGMVPHQRVEYTARTITAHVTVDHEQIRAYRLGEAKTELVEALAMFELANLFNGESLRLRTACELEPAEQQEGPSLPSLEEATQRVADALAAARSGLGEVTTVRYGGKSARAKKQAAAPVSEG